MIQSMLAADLVAFQVSIISSPCDIVAVVVGGSGGKNWTRVLLIAYINSTHRGMKSIDATRH